MKFEISLRKTLFSVGFTWKVDGQKARILKFLKQNDNIWEKNRAVLILLEKKQCFENCQFSFYLTVPVLGNNGEQSKGEYGCVENVQKAHCSSVLDFHQLYSRVCTPVLSTTCKKDVFCLLHPCNVCLPENDSVTFKDSSKIKGKSNNFVPKNHWWKNTLLRVTHASFKTPSPIFIHVMHYFFDDLVMLEKS